MEEHNFGWALEQLKYGKMVARSGWNGKGMFIYKTVGNTVSKDFIPKFTSLPDSVKQFLQQIGGDVQCTQQPEKCSLVG